MKPHSGESVVTHGELIRYLESRIPPELAEEWDNCGLQLGCRQQPLQGIICCLDPTPAVVEEARRRRADFIFSHHPLFFKPLKYLDLESHQGSMLQTMVREGITLYSAHTNLDKIRGGVSDRLAELLGLQDPRPLEPASRRVYKLVTFVPPAALAEFEEALFAAGAGVLGDGSYRECAFRTEGTGSFHPAAGSRPRLGEVGRRNLVTEIRFETVCEAAVLYRVLQTLHEVHPYEVPAYDLLPMEPKEMELGFGRVGNLAEEVSLPEFVRWTGKCLGGAVVRLIGGTPELRVRRVALCGGSGFSLYRSAMAAGADLYLTGDVKYHEAREVVDGGGIPLLDAGHFATERPVVKSCVQICRDFLAVRGLTLPVAAAACEQEPWSCFQ